MPTPNSSSPQASASPDPAVSPNYEQLVRFLIHPFLETPDSLRVNCEMFHRNDRVLIRVAFEGEDKGRVFGRGGRNIQAIRTIVQAAAQEAGQTAHLDIYNSGGGHGHDDSSQSSSRSPSRPQRSHSKPKRGNRGSSGRT